jgi:hypothetical protein
MTEFVWLIVVTDCSDCFRLERLRGRAWTHWKVRPCHGAHPSRTSRDVLLFAARFLAL